MIAPFSADSPPFLVLSPAIYCHLLIIQVGKKGGAYRLAGRQRPDKLLLFLAPPFSPGVHPLPVFRE